MNYNHISKHSTPFTRNLCLIAAIIASILATSCQQMPVEKEIVIISTNDIHGNIANLPRLATLIHQTREKYKHVILVDAGDRFVGNPYVDYAPEKGKPIITLMNELGYDVATIGNHEFDFGQKILRERIDDAEFPVICANINSSSSTLDSLPPYVTLTIDGLKFCFLGLIQIYNDGIPDTNPTHMENITFDHFEEKIARYKEFNKNCDVFIGLTHLGVNADSILATLMPELDLIIGGHTHTLLQKPKTINNVMICQAGAQLTRAGITRLKFKDNKLTERSYHTIRLDSIMPDSLIMAQVNQYTDQPEFNKIIGHLSFPLSSKEEIAEIVTKAMAEISQCDFAFYNHGGIRISTLPKKEIVLKDIFNIEPFANNIVIHEMTTEDIKKLILNRSYTNYNTCTADLFMSPGKYKILTDQYNKGIDVIFFNKKGELLPDKKLYRVALNTYVNSKYNFPGKGKGVKTNITITDAVIRFLQKNEAL